MLGVCGFKRTKCVVYGYTRYTVPWLLFLYVSVLNFTKIKLKFLKIAIYIFKIVLSIL